MLLQLMLYSRVWDMRKQIVVLMIFFFSLEMSSSTCLPPRNIFMKLTWNISTQMFSLSICLKAEDLFSFFFFSKYLYHKRLKNSVTIQDYVKQQHRWYFPYKSIYTVLNESHQKKLKYSSTFKDLLIRKHRRFLKVYLLSDYNRLLRITQQKPEFYYTGHCDQSYFSCFYPNSHN